LPKEILDPVRKKAADNKNSIASVIRGMVCSELRREGIITDETAATCV
jgi:hypothetical protein